MKTKAPAAPVAEPKKGGLNSAVPVRFDDTDRDLIQTLQQRTGLSAADIVRRAVRFAGPKFRDGKANIGDLTESKAA